MIAPEGKRILIPLLILGFSLGIVAHYYNILWLQVLYGVIGGLFIFSLNFFRDPHRILPTTSGAVVSPADGKIVNISTIHDPDVGENSTLVSIFLNVFNVHVNRVPITGTVASVHYKKGRFLAAFDHKASDENEQAVVVMEQEGKQYKIKQIAGLIARRILCYAQEGKEMQQGGRLGYIMFGSRTDLILPPEVKLQVKMGQKVYGTETIIGVVK